MQLQIRSKGKASSSRTFKLRIRNTPKQPRQGKGSKPRKSRGSRMLRRPTKAKFTYTVKNRRRERTKSSNRKSRHQQISQRKPNRHGNCHAQARQRFG